MAQDNFFPSTHGRIERALLLILAPSTLGKESEEMKKLQKPVGEGELCCWGQILKAKLLKECRFRDRFNRVHGQMEKQKYK